MREERYNHNSCMHKTPAHTPAHTAQVIHLYIRQKHRRLSNSSHPLFHDHLWPQRDFFFEFDSRKTKAGICCAVLKANKLKMFSPVLKPRWLIWLGQPWLAVCACLPRLGSYFDMNIVQEKNQKKTTSELEPLNSGLINYDPYLLDCNKTITDPNNGWFSDPVRQKSSGKCFLYSGNYSTCFESFIKVNFPMRWFIVPNDTGVTPKLACGSRRPKLK